MQSSLINSLSCFFSRNKYALILTALIVVVLYPLSFFMYMPKWDSVNGYLPYRYFISFYLENDQMPFWNPFQRMGYPGYADLQSGCWYPITRFLMLFGQYDVTSLNIELVSCFVIAGLGMYRLSLFLHESDKTAFLIGLSYALSGFMIGSTHLMVFLIGAAWLPWIIWSILSFFKTLKKKYAYLAAVFVAMNITGASPAFTILLVYIIVGLLMYQITRNLRDGQRLRLLWSGGWRAGLLLAAMLAPYVLSFVDFAPYFNRLGKRPYEEMIMNPFVIGDYVSFVFPYAVNDVKCEWFKPTDLSLRNGYIGLLGLLTLGVVLTRFRNRSVYTVPLVLCAVSALLLAMGDHFFLYKYIYHLPGFGVFRHPSFFRIYAILCLLLLAGFGLKALFAGEKLSRKNYIGLGVFAVLVVLSIALSWLHSSKELITQAWQEIVSMAEIPSAGVHTLILINGAAILMLVVLFILLYWLFKVPLLWSLVIVVFLDHGIQARLTGPTTMHYTFGYDKMNEYFAKLPSEINQEFNKAPMKLLNDKYGVTATDGIWVNVSTFNKTLSWEGENPLRFKDYEEAYKNGVLERNLENPLFYFAERTFESGDSLMPGYIWGLPEQAAFDTTKTTIGKVVVGFNQFAAEVTNLSEEPQWLVLNQNYHHHWKASLSGKQIPVYRVNEMVMAVKVPPTSQTVMEFKYDNKWIARAWKLSLLAYLLVIVVVLSEKLKARKA